MENHYESLVDERLVIGKIAKQEPGCRRAIRFSMKAHCSVRFNYAMPH